MYNYMYNSYVLNFMLPANDIHFAKTAPTKKYWTGLFYMIDVYVHTYKLKLFLSSGLKYFKIINTPTFTMSGGGGIRP
jgi:hypothetical protein